MVSPWSDPLRFRAIATRPTKAQVFRVIKENAALSLCVSLIREDLVLLSGTVAGGVRPSIELVPTRRLGENSAADALANHDPHLILIRIRITPRMKTLEVYPLGELAVIVHSVSVDVRVRSDLYSVTGLSLFPTRPDHPDHLVLTVCLAVLRVDASRVSPLVDNLNGDVFVIARKSANVSNPFFIHVESETAL